MSILRHNKMKYGTEQGHFLGQEKLTYVITRQILGLKEVIFWDGRSGFWVSLRKIMGHHNVFFGDRIS